MQIRPGRTQSLIGGILALVVMIVGLVMMNSFNRFGGFDQPGGAGGFGSIAGIFTIVWVLFGLIAAGVSFYNAFSEKGVPIYEIKMQDQNKDGSSFCPQCGKPTGTADRFCKNCGTELK